MSRDAYRSSTGDFSPRGERWDRERFHSERDRYDDRPRYYEEDDRYYVRESRGPPPRPRETQTRFYDDEYVRDRRHYWDDEPQHQRAPPSAELERKVVIERERLRSPSPPRRPGALLRRQSSLDTFDRRPTRFYEREHREEYGPPARREDFRPPPNVPIPLPRTRALPPPRRYAEREEYEQIRVSDPDYYGDDDFHGFPERVREREVVRTRRRNRSRDSHSTRTTTTRSSSRSSSVTSRSSSHSGTTMKSEYPKKGKTRIPGRLVSKRALIDLRYPFIEEGNTIVVQKALGQDNIDTLLKLSEEYKKSELEIEAARSHAGDIIEERREEFIMAPAVPAVPIAVPVPAPAPPPPAAAPIVVPAVPMPPPAAPVEVFNSTTVIRDVSPARSAITTTSASSDRSHVVVNAAPRAVEVSDAVAVGPFALVAADRHHSRHRSHSRGERRLMMEVHGDRHEHHHHHRHGSSSRDIVTAERLPTGELVMYEERVEKIEAPRKGLRIEKDKKGRMSISVPKYR